MSESMDSPSAAHTSNSQVVNRVMAAQKRQTLPTLPLPAEVRLMVYEHVFSKSYVVIWVHGVPARNLSILRVSSATKKEASEVLYSKSIFVFAVSEYRSVSSQIYKTKTSGLRNAGIRLFEYPNPQGKYERFTAITNRFIRALTSNSELERFEIHTESFEFFDASNSICHAWERLASLKSFSLLGKCKEITLFAQTMFDYESDDEDYAYAVHRDDFVGQDPFRLGSAVLKQTFEETLGLDIQFETKNEIKFDEAQYTGGHLFKATVRPN